ncbi:cupin domain-containing protein [Actinokineospora auranticolor]|uniref:Cupin domain-containing protein n=1 Tax=Actinokineospora auranticolor TaxID=155976 RepID=A0A2S6GJQ8_9PSEU|nr:cupin domain-containing protein [Actinokineospora auranticolor]PPK65430.1 Cupin domain-containing protein [Actinokineospora auranticolor]
MLIVKKHSLPTVRLNGEVGAYIFDGGDHGAAVSAFIVDVPACLGPHRHRHPYDELFVITEGTVVLEADGEIFEATPDDVCVVPAGVPHAFHGSPQGRVKMVNIHAAAKVVTEFVDDPAPAAAEYEYDHKS